TPLNAGLGPNGRFALHTAPLADLKAAGKAAVATVNNALLAAVAGMLRSYLEAAGEPLGKPLVALVPVSVRRPGEEGGNRMSTVLVDLPVAERDPRRADRSDPRDDGHAQGLRDGARGRDACRRLRLGAAARVEPAAARDGQP